MIKAVINVISTVNNEECLVSFDKEQFCTCNMLLTLNDFDTLSEKSQKLN